MAVGFGFLSLLLTTGAAASAAAPREPTAKWNVAFDDAQCLASRNFGSAEEPLRLVLKAPPLGEVMQVAVLRNGGYAPPTQVDATIGIDDQPPLKTNLLTFGSKNSKTRIHTLNLPARDFSRVRGAKSLSIRSSGLNETFSVSQIEPLLKVMDECVADLRRVWNVGSLAPDQPSGGDGEAFKLAKRATADLSKVVKNEDYPEVAIRQDATGVVKFVILIDETGRVADCTVIETSGVAALDAQTCALLQRRAKFDPAAGADGKPSKDAHIQKLRWVMPK